MQSSKRHEDYLLMFIESLVIKGGCRLDGREVHSQSPYRQTYVIFVVDFSVFFIFPLSTNKLLFIDCLQKAFRLSLFTNDAFLGFHKIDFFIFCGVQTFENRSRNQIDSNGDFVTVLHQISVFLFQNQSIFLIFKNFIEII